MPQDCWSHPTRPHLFKSRKFDDIKEEMFHIWIFSSLKTLIDSICWFHPHLYLISILVFCRMKTFGRNSWCPNLWQRDKLCQCILIFERRVSYLRCAPKNLQKMLQSTFSSDNDQPVVAIFFRNRCLRSIQAPNEKIPIRRLLSI